jgi:hypothetical protein
MDCFASLAMTGLGLKTSPTGKSKNLSIPQAKNIPLSPSGKSSLQACPIPPHQEGRIMIVTNVGRDAVDAMARERRTALSADGEVVWS